MSMTPRTSAKDERGATAILFAVLAVVLLGVSAIAVDVGQIYAKRASLQSAVDLAVIAAAAQLDGSNTCSGAAITAANNKLTENWIDNTGDPIALNLSTPSRSDGFLECTGWRARLWAPTATVTWGLARAVTSQTGVEVPAYAEAGVFSPRSRVFPAFATGGCDSGSQTLVVGSSGTTGLPTNLPQQTNPDTTNYNFASALNPDETPAGVDPGVIILDGGNQLSRVRRVSLALDGGANVILATNVTSASGQVTFQLPAGFDLVTQQVWWVRVSRFTTGTRWSDDALPFRVGAAYYECGAASSTGNFGSTNMFRTPAVNNANERLALNIISGPTFSTEVYPNPQSDWTCAPGGVSVVSTSAIQLDRTNCLDTDTGLASAGTEMGLLSGVGALDGILDQIPTRAGCGSDEDWPLGGSIGTVYINNERLSCYELPGTTTAYQNKSYSGAPVLDPAIFGSPRYFWVPVFGRQASPGGSTRYQIIDFRPMFITSDDDSANNLENGLGYRDIGSSARTLDRVKVVFFSANALPPEISSGNTMNYLGVGTKVIRLTD
jgi:hypothetical protein